MSQIIILRLEGVLQSWGENAKWNHRTTASFPTKSSIVGLIACALGLQRGNYEIFELSSQINIGVRADRKGFLINDFQTVQGNPVLGTADGKGRSGKKNTIITPRQYLSDACFTVFIETNREIQDKIVSALKNPVWPVYLGRKSCVPSRPVFENVTDFDSILSAIQHYPFPTRKDTVIEYEISGQYGNNSFTRPDNVVGNRQFANRYVQHGVLKGI